MADLTAQPLGPTGGFNWVFLVDLLVCMVLALFFLFYFNRLFATVLSYAIRAWTWHKYRAYIDISALQISLLGGRLFFKSLRYHAHNETVLVHDGHVTWRYWLRAVQEAEIFNDLEEDKLKKKRSGSTSGTQESDSGTSQKQRSRSRSMSKAEAGGKQRKELPCRISVKVSGVEAFLYNRSPAYDMIIEAANRQTGRSKGSQDENSKPDTPPASSGSDSNEKTTDSKEDPNLRKTDTATTSFSQEQHQAPQVPSFLRMLPIKIYCKKAAAAVGNENTTSVITAKLDNAAGTFDAGKAGSLDIFKLLMKFEFKNINVAMKPNRDFKQLQLDSAKRIVRERELHGRTVEAPTFHPFEGLKAPIEAFKTLLCRRKRSNGSIRAGSGMHDAPTAAAQEPVPGQAQWHGLMRYLDDNEEGINEWEDVEYAKASTLVDVDQIDMRFYWDIPGKVPQASGEKDHLLQSDEEDHMNGSKPPDYGLEFAVYGGFIVYGPWADRQRINLQNVFFPGSCVDATPSQPLKPGTDRVSTIFKIFISIEKDVTLRIPTREPSKDSKWQGRANRNKPDNEQETTGGKGKHGRKHRRRKGKKSAPADARPYAWLDVKVKADTTVNYVMDMFARHDGYRNSLGLDVKGTEITSSVNHGLLWRAGALSMEADLSYPIAWNTLRDWPFQITCDDLELFILRDHMFLITDLVNDWSSGPPPDFYTFVPYKYGMNLNFRNWTMYLNTNDANIINDPAEFDNNEFLTLEGQNLQAVLDIPLENFRPKVNDISFDVLSLGMSMRMLNSPRNTLKTLLPEKQVAELPKLTLKGSFSANQESAAGLCDVLRMDLVGYGLSLEAYGFLVRHFINVKENYFGDYVHFKTLEEFQDAGNDLNESNEKTISLPKPQTANEMDVILCIAAEDATVMFPTNLYLADDFVRVDVQHGAIDLRLTSYYMDLAINFSPINCLLGSNSDDSGSPDDSVSSTQLCIRHVDLNGHRAFGLPPNEPAYAATWDVNVGSIIGELQENFVHDLALAAQAFAFTFPDGENALPIDTPNVFYEVTFLQLRTDTLRIWVHAENDAFLLSADPVNVDFNDWADKKFSERVSVLVPNLTVACVDGKSASRHRLRKHQRHPVRTYAFIQTSVALSVIGRKKQHEEELQKQQAYLHNNDKRTRRMSFLQRNVPRRESFQSVDEAGVQPPTVPCPSLPFPVDGDGQPRSRPMSIKSTRSFVSNRLLRSKSSKSSLSASIRSNSKLAVPQAAGARSQRSSSRSRRSVSSRASSEVSSERRRTLPNDRERVELGFLPSTMAFSSSYSEPYFPLDLIDPDESNVPKFELPYNTETESLDDEPEVNFDQNAESSQTSILIRLVPGVRAYIEPRAALAAATLLRVLQPKKTEDIMDAYQVSVMNTIAGHQQEQSGPGNILDIKLNVPSAPLRVCVANEHDVAPDVADVCLKGLSLMVRQKKEPALKDRQEKLAFHVVLSSLKASLHENFRTSPEETALSLSVDDVTTWFALAAVKTFHVSIRDIAVLTSSRKASYLTALAQRLAPLAQELEESFAKPLNASHKRLQVLVHTLTEHGEHIGDPPFMSRMTYILRAFRDHYRNQESWKVLMRFRHTLQCMPKGVLFELETHFQGEHISCPASIGQQVLESWTAWRNWDVPNIGRTTALQMLFGEKEEMPLHSPDAKPTAFTWDTEHLKVAIDQGEGANKVVVDDISVGLEISPPKVPTGLMLVDENKRTKTQLQIHAGAIGFRFDWNVIGIIETVVPEVQLLISATKPAEEHRSPSQALEEGLNRRDIHVVISTDTGSILLETINLRHHSQADGMRMSLIGTTQATEKYGECLSIVVHAESAVTELRSPTACIWQTLLTAPNIYVDWLQPAKGVDTPPTITLALAYGELQIDVKEQAPGILQIVDHIVNDEVSQVQKLAKLIQNTVPPPTPGDGTASPSKPVKFHAAVLAGKLMINFSLLQALSYRMEVTAASLRVAPSLVKQHSLGIDFNVGAQNHAFVNHSGDEDHEQGLLEVPPIVGHVGLELKSDRTRISVATTVKKVEIDAGTIQSIVTVINKKEVQDVLSEIKSGIEDVKHSVSEVFPKNAETEAEATPSARTTPDKLIIYDVQFALLGVRVSARTPHLAAHSTAEMEIGIGPLHAKASNQANIDAGDASLFPEVKGKVQDVGANLTILEGRLRRHVGSAKLAAVLDITLDRDENGALVREVVVRSPGLEVNAYPETASIIVDVANHMQDRIKELDLSREVDYIRRLRAQRKHRLVKTISGRERKGSEAGMPFSATDLLAMRVTVEFSGIQVAWLVDPSYAPNPKSAVQDLVLSLARVEFITRGGHEARLTMQDLQLQLVPKKASKTKRTLNSALLPEVGFSVGYWSQDKNRSLAFKATGKPLDIRLESRFIVPVSGVQKSVEFAIERFRVGTANWQSTPTTSGMPRAKMFGKNHFASLLVEADFAGAHVYLQGAGPGDPTLSTIAAASQEKAKNGKYGQFSPNGDIIHTSLKAPGIALKLEYNDTEARPSVSGELRIDASKNLLLPNVVPLILEVSDSVKEIMQSQENKETPATPTAPVAKSDVKPAQRFFEDESIVKADPTAIFGKTKVDLGVRICKQEFGLTCQPIARVDATAQLEDFYFTINTLDSEEQGHFFAMSAVLTKLSTHVKHVYSREPTFSFDMDSIVMSLMNSKHFSGVNGISAILKINPTKTSINAKQLQDVLLFREIWLPPEIRNAQASSQQGPQQTQSDDYLVQRYQNVAAAAAFPWNATISIAELGVDLDLGQSIGKSSFTISNLWASSQKTSNAEQNLCIGIDDVAANSHGRMSGFIQLNKFGVRTSIRWPEESQNTRQTPLIQASVGFQRLRAKAAFDYQAFAFGDIEGFDFLMYNVRDTRATDRDRLVAVLDCAKAYVFCTSTSPAQAYGLYQAFDRLIQEKQAAFEHSLKDIEKQLRRDSTAVASRAAAPQAQQATAKLTHTESRTPFALNTDVVVTVGAISVGAFPGTFFDSQVLKLEANNIQARFAVGLEKGRIHSGLGMTLGQLQVALGSAKRVTVPKTLGDITVDEVISSAVNSKGGTILRVPKVVASMQTWQAPDSNDVEYVFKSLFEGKIDVGWNLSRINFIKGMYVSHTRALASRLGKPLPESAVKITAGPQKDTAEGGDDNEQAPKDTVKPPGSENEQQKITAEVNLPQSRYEYKALEPPIIETPQLRDMGEATPPLEWIGLHRDRLPNVTHQIIIVSLLEVAKEVEDAYGRILGSSGS